MGQHSNDMWVTQRIVPWFLVVLVLLVITGCGERRVDPRFLQVKEGRFILNGKQFFPLGINYIVSLQTNGNEVWPSAHKDYHFDKELVNTTAKSSLEQIKAEMALMSEMGFNSIRIVNVAEMVNIDPNTGALRIDAQVGNDRDTTIEITDGIGRERYLHAIDTLLAIAGACKLKVVILLRLIPGDDKRMEHVMGLVSHLKNDTNIMAFDVYNEPLYFDLQERSKTEVRDIVHDWRRQLRKASPHHLMTIGLEGIREVFEWDPNILEVDFISFHPYEYEPEQVRNEIRWFGSQVSVPWIIGETAIPADNDSVPYNDQVEFARKTLRQAISCGAVGYTWWQFKDMTNDHFHSDHMGVVNMNGTTKTQNGALSVLGTPKPVAQVFKEFDRVHYLGTCEDLPNYLNYSDHHTCKITGKVVDQKNAPIENAVILGWNEWWDHSYHTTTKADGSFELKGDFYFYHWMISAVDHDMVRGDCLPNTARTGVDGIPAMSLGKVRIEPL